MKASFFLKIIVLVISLAGVIYAIVSLRENGFGSQDQDQNSAMSLLLGGDYRPINWCPTPTERVEILDPTGQVMATVTDEAEISALCEIMMGAFSSEGVSEADYKTRLIAYDKQGNSKSMEQNLGQSVFRFEGMPFSSPMLIKALERLPKPNF